MENHEKSGGRGLQHGTRAMCFSWQGTEGNEEDMSELDRSRQKWKGEVNKDERVAETLALQLGREEGFGRQYGLLQISQVTSGKSSSQLEHQFLFCTKFL